MPHGWRSAARSPVSRRACAKSDRPPRLDAAITGAFVDRTPIDWGALLDRIRDSEQRSSIEALRHLDELRRRLALHAQPAPARARGMVVRVLLAVAALQTACGLVNGTVAVAAGWTAEDLAPHLLLTVAFALASLLLVSASSRDPRSLFLLATFTFAASAFARAVLQDLDRPWPATSTLLFRGVYPEAFAQAALWRFAVVFPRVRRFTPFDVFVRRCASLAFVLAAALFAANVLVAYGIAGAPLAMLRRDDPRNLFWHLFVLAALPALATIIIRAFRAPSEERAKVVRFALAVVGGAAPLLLAGLARLLFPEIDRWVLTANGDARRWLDVTVIGGLVAIPVLTTVALVVDHTVDIQALVPNPVRGWIAGRGFRIRTAIQSRLLRGSPHHERLSTALDRVRLARGPREISAVLRRELRLAVGTSSVEILDVAALPAHTALVPLLEAASIPIDLSRDREPFTLLPRGDREWLDAHMAVGLAAIRLRDGSIAGVALLGPRRVEGPLSRADRWFIWTLLTGAAAAWDGSPAQSAAKTGADEVALECPRCGLVADDEPLSCCGSEPILAALPRNIGGRFTVVRRLGEGGMGVVYLGRDAALGRDVALKTLPAVREAMASRLRDEARAMAALNHEALATIYGLELWRRTPVLVVEFFPGGTLAERLAHGALPLREAMALGIRLADALTYMHARGMLHRDLKPNNIGLTSEGLAKLLDFGLAIDRETPAGTPEYLPPEAIEDTPAGSAVDLWGLSTVLLKTCGGRSALPPVARAFFDRALARNPEDRFQSSLEIRAELVRLLGFVSGST